jgi:hypothetical protein
MSEETKPSTATTTTETEQEGPGDREPTPERQAELRAAYEANVAAGKAPYERAHPHARRVTLGHAGASVVGRKRAAKGI